MISRYICTSRFEQYLAILLDTKSIFWRTVQVSNAMEVPRPKAQPPSWYRERPTVVDTKIAYMEVRQRSPTVDD
jgi:hypothetical protein